MTPSACRPHHALRALRSLRAARARKADRSRGHAPRPRFPFSTARQKARRQSRLQTPRRIAKRETRPQDMRRKRPRRRMPRAAREARGSTRRKRTPHPARETRRAQAIRTHVQLTDSCSRSHHIIFRRKKNESNMNSFQSSETSRDDFAGTSMSSSARSSGESAMPFSARNARSFAGVS